MECDTCGGKETVREYLEEGGRQALVCKPCPDCTNLGPCPDCDGTKVVGKRRFEKFYNFVGDVRRDGKIILNNEAPRAARSVTLVEVQCHNCKRDRLNELEMADEESS